LPFCKLFAKKVLILTFDFFAFFLTGGVTGGVDSSDPTRVNPLVHRHSSPLWWGSGVGMSNLLKKTADAEKRKVYDFWLKNHRLFIDKLYTFCS